MGLLDSILSLFGSGNDPALARKKRLQQIAKELSKNKYGKFYRPKAGELEPAFAKFFYDIYKVISSTQIFLQNASKSDQLKLITIDTFLNKELLALKDRLSGPAIMERAGTMPVKELAAQVRKELSHYIAAFDNNLINRIDNAYNTIIALAKFACFDYFFVLKKFDPAISERSFSYQPKFQGVRATELTEMLKDFLEFSASIEQEQDWKAPLAILKIYKEGIDVVNPDLWAKLLRVLKDVSRSRILELMVQHITSDPLWISTLRLPDERMADKLLEAKKTEVENALNKIENDKKSAQIEQLCKVIFNTTEVERLSNYIVRANEPYYKKNFDGYTKAAALNYLKAFLLDFFKKEIRELCDLFIVRGQWSNTSLSLSMSDAYHNVLDTMDQITALDESLGEKGDHGTRLRQALLKVDRDKGQVKYIKSILKGINDSAQLMINSTAANLITIGKNFKSLIEDMPKKPSELIMNWKELESASNSDVPLAKRLVEDYKRLYNFVQLLQCFTAPVEPPDNT